MQRNTIQKELILESVKKLCNHPTPEQVYEYVSKKYPTISRSTVYRNINTLCENGNLMRIQVPNGADHIDHTIYSHYHVVCRKCQCVADLETGMMPNFIEYIYDYNGYDIDEFKIIFSGLCPKCKSKNQ